MSGPIIDPMPPLATASLPWDAAVPDTVALLGRLRAELGDTFVIDSGSDRYLFLFDRLGVKSFYDVVEEQASKGIADWKMIRRKLPDEIFHDRRTLPHELFGRSDVAMYMDALDEAIDMQFDELGNGGEIDPFAFSRKLGHRLGLGSWAGQEILRSARFDELIEALDALDPSESFVNPELMDRVEASGKAHEWAALKRAESILAAVIEHRRNNGEASADLLGTIIDRWADRDSETANVGISRDVVLVHLGSMSNLFAALGWTIVHLSQHQDVLQRVAAGEPGLLTHCILESTRLAQRSIMMRTVLRDIVIADNNHTYSVQAGATLATFLPLTNLHASPGLADYNPDRWVRGRLANPPQDGVELVTTFGHGPHACPARPFSMQAMSRVVERLLRSYRISAPVPDPRPIAGQIGGVARPASTVRATWSKL